MHVRERTNKSCAEVRMKPPSLHIPCFRSCITLSLSVPLDASIGQLETPAHTVSC